MKDRNIGINLLFLITADALAFGVYTIISLLVNLILPSGASFIVETLLLCLWMLIIQSGTALLLYFVQKRGKTFNSKYASLSYCDDFAGNIKHYYIENGLLIAYLIIGFVNLISVILGTFGKNFGLINALFFPMFATETIPQHFFEQTSASKIVGFAVAFILFPIIHNLIATLALRRSGDGK